MKSMKTSKVNQSVVGRIKVEGSVVIDSNTKNIIKATVLLDANGFSN